MVRDPYGNYVVQKILDIADDRQQEALCSYLRCVRGLSGVGRSYHTMWAVRTPPLA